MPKPFPKGNKLATGGAREGAGRKPSELTILRRLTIAEAHGEAEASLQFCVDIRNDENSPGALRLEAAKEIMNRVWGKPAQSSFGEDEDGKLVVYSIVVQTKNPQPILNAQVA